jgi:hypothetical protein
MSVVQVDEGVKRLIYGMKKVSPWAVKLENGVMVTRPGPPFPGDCRGCGLCWVVCEDDSSPCRAVYASCEKHANILCDECEELWKCLDEKPCCWNCEYLDECLEMARDNEEFVEDRFKCSWEEFVEAVRVLYRKDQ